MSDPLDRLAEINLDDLVNSIGWQDLPILAKAVRFLFHGAAKKFARHMLVFDQQTGESDLASASRKTLGRYVREVRAYGLENLPPRGPLLVLSNHPGMSDTLCAFAVINRPDIRSIALERPFLQSLPNVSRTLFYISEDPSERLSAVRKAAAHLRGGGVVLTFPAGKIEPDPDVYPGALESLDDWTDSAGVFMRFAPETKIIPVLMRNVLWEKVVTNPITKLKHDRFEREKLGAAFQLLAHVLFDLRNHNVRVQIGEPLTSSEIGSKDLPSIHAAVLARMRGLISNPPQGEGVLIL